MPGTTARHRATVPDTPAETIRGTIARTRYQNPANGYCIVGVLAGDELITAVGYLPSIREGDEYAFTGRWVEHPKFGRQFQFERHELIIPTSRKGLTAYLSTLAYGVGEKKAAAIVDALGEEDLISRILLNPQALTAIPGVHITEAQAREIGEKLAENTVLAELSGLICRYGITPRLAAAIYAQYGPESVQVVRENPYVLADEMHGVGFATADKIALGMGIRPDSPYRVRAAIKYVLREAVDEGHCYLMPRDIVPAVTKLCGPNSGIGVDEIARANAELIRLGQCVREGIAVYLPELHQAECAVARSVRWLLAQPVTEFTTPEKERRDEVIEVAQKAVRMIYETSQRDALLTALQSPLSIITGGPGTGKTTIINGLLATYEHFYPGRPIYLCAPTGRAAKRMSEVTGREACTIHRLLGYVPEVGFSVNEDNPLKGPGLLVADEVSMADVSLAANLLAAVPANVQVVLVGDVDQLPSVGPGSVLRDLISSGVVPTVRLVYNYRQAQGSKIAAWADEIRQGIVPDLRRAGGDVEFISLPDEQSEMAVSAVETVIRQAIADGYGVMDYQVLAPMRKSSSGVTALNEAVRALANPLPAEEEVNGAQGRQKMAPGDKVMVTKNDYRKDVFNGDLGVVTELTTARDDEGAGVRVDIDGRPVHFGMDELGMLQLAYAGTIHKSQGSEFPFCVVVLTRSHWIMLQRNLLYTAVTRARHRLVLIGQESAIEQAVRNDRIEVRYSMLRERLVSLE